MRAGIVAGAVVVAALAGCGSGGSSSAAATATATAGQDSTAAAAATLSPHQQCVAAVTGLLERNERAVQQGYSEGIDLGSIMDEYGAQSPIFESYGQLQASEIYDFAEYGYARGLPMVVAEVPQECKTYGA